MVHQISDLFPVDFRCTSECEILRKISFSSFLNDIALLQCSCFSFKKCSTGSVNIFLFSAFLEHCSMKVLLWKGKPWARASPDAEFSFLFQVASCSIATAAARYARSIALLRCSDISFPFRIHRLKRELHN